MSTKNIVFQDFAQGDAFFIKVSHNPVPVKGTGGITGIAGATFEVTLKANEHGSAVMSISYLVPAGDDATAGVAYIPITAADTGPVAPGEYFGSIKRAYATEEAKTLIRTDMNNTRKVKVFKNLKNT